MSQRIQSLRGFNDVLPAEAGAWRRFEDAVQKVMDLYGYQEIRLPLLEATELFKRSVGEATDIVEKEMFSFLDREKNSLSLRPEATASCVRAGIEHGLLHNQQQRLWYRGPMFRHERPQAGRFRQFHQVGIEAFGMAGPDIDIEVIALSARLLRELGLLAGADLQLELNSLGSPEARAAYRGALVAFLQRHEAALDADSKRRLQTNPLRVLDSKAPATRELLAQAPSLLEHLDAESRAHLQAVQDGLNAIGIGFVVNPRIVRGLDYYNRTVFEWTTTRLGAQGTVCAGGRYDGLVAQLGGGEVPAVGFAMGVERVLQLCKALAEPAAASEAAFAPHAYFCWQGEGSHAAALRLAEALRSPASGPLRVLLHAGGGKLAAQLKRADKSGARFALILGEQELAQQRVQIKHLREGAQDEVAWQDLPAKLAASLGRER